MVEVPEIPRFQLLRYSCIINLHDNRVGNEAGKRRKRSTDRAFAY